MRKIRTQSLHFFIFYFSVSSHHGSGASLWCPNIRFGKIWRKFQGELTGYQAVSILAACYQPVSAISQVSALAIDWRGDDGRHIRSQVSHFFPFQIRTSPSKAFLRDFPLFSNGSLFFSQFVQKVGLVGIMPKAAWFWDNWGWQRCADLRVKIPIREQRVLCRTVPAFLPWIWNKLQLHWFPLLVPFVKPQLMVEPLRGQKKKILLSSKPFNAAFTGSDLIEHFTRSFLTLI